MKTETQEDHGGLAGEVTGLAHMSGDRELDVSHGVILYLEDVTVSFDGFKALDRLTMTIDVGEMRCIIGPNGAGKTTMMDVVTGKTRPESGQVFFGQTMNLLQMQEHQIALSGIGRKFQKPTVFENHSVFENLELALHGNKGVWQTLFARLSSRQKERIEEILNMIGLRDQMQRPAGLLSHGQKQWLEIGMLLAQSPKLLLLDEPAAGMTGREVDFTVELLTSLAGNHSIIVVEHDMAFVSALARTVTVLHEGRVLVEGRMDQIRNDPRVQEVYLGTS